LKTDFRAKLVTFWQKKKKNAQMEQKAFFLGKMPLLTYKN
jgi:hypothetical protein